MLLLACICISGGSLHFKCDLLMEDTTQLLPPPSFIKCCRSMIKTQLLISNKLKHSNYFVRLKHSISNQCSGNKKSLKLIISYSSAVKAYFLFFQISIYELEKWRIGWMHITGVVQCNTLLYH